MKREKIFNSFIFLSTLARSLVDCFIPIILYKRGLGEQSIIFFLIMNYSLLFLLNVPLGSIGKKISFKWAMIITSFLIGISYYFLLMKEQNIINLLLFTLFHVINTHIYWLSRHYYTLEILPKRNIADDVGNIIIVSTLALIPVSYVGALLMNNLDKKLIFIIVTFLYMVSVVPLFLMKEKKKEFTAGVLKSAKYIIKDIPRRSFWFIILVQFKMISRYLFPLFLFINVKNNFEYIGVFNITVGVASMFFVYFFARKMDRDKKDYLILSGVLGSAVYLLKLNIIDSGIMLLIGLFEGLVDKMYEVAFNRNLYALGHHYEGIGYIVAIEGLQNFSRILITLLFALLLLDLSTVLYVSAFMLIITGLIGFDDGKGGY